jgi:hypothetical protein
MAAKPELGSPKVDLESTFGALSRKRNRVRVLRDDARRRSSLAIYKEAPMLDLLLAIFLHYPPDPC